jgi:hypothetical protein
MQDIECLIGPVCDVGRSGIFAGMRCKKSEIICIPCVILIDLAILRECDVRNLRSYKSHA